MVYNDGHVRCVHFRKFTNQNLCTRHNDFLTADTVPGAFTGNCLAVMIFLGSSYNSLLD